MNTSIWLVCLIALVASVHSSSEGPDFSYGLHIASKLVRQYINSQPEDLKIVDGVHLVSTVSENDTKGRSADDGTILGAVGSYLQSHEVRIKLPELMPQQGIARALKDVLDGYDTSEVGTARRRKNSGGGGILILGAMMGKMMAALGIGAVGLLAMKALAISAVALMLSLVIGLKKLVSSGGDDGGHHVIHATSGHDHRRKREATDMAYYAWLPSFN